MKTGDIVYGKLHGQWGKCIILSITKVTKGYLWWKKTVEIALVKFTVQQWDKYGALGLEYDITVERPVSKLRVNQ